MITKLDTRPRHPVRNPKSVNTYRPQSVWEAAAEMERQRLGRDLHDTVVQTLFAANLIAEMLSKTRTQTPDMLRDSLDELRQLTQRALTETRDLLLELRPAIPTDKAMEAILQEMAMSFTNQTQIPNIVIVEGHSWLDPDLQLALCQIVREAFNNIIKHAHASEVNVLLQGQGDNGKIVIQDNGRGFNMSLISLGCCGLEIMSEHANSVGAKVAITSESGKGTQVVISW